MRYVPRAQIEGVAGTLDFLRRSLAKPAIIRPEMSHHRRRAPSGSDPITNVSKDAEQNGYTLSSDTATLSSVTATYNTVAVFVGMHTASRTISSITYNGTSCTIHRNTSDASLYEGYAIGTVSGETSGDVVLTFSGTGVTYTCIVASFDNCIDDSTAIDVDENTSYFSASSPLTALTTPGDGGIRLACSTAYRSFGMSYSSVTGCTYIDHNVRVSNYCLIAAYSLGDSSGTMTMTFNAVNGIIAGGVSLR